MEQRIIGRSGPSVSALGLGCMSIGIADVYTSSVREDRAAVALIHRALDSGITPARHRRHNMASRRFGSARHSEGGVGASLSPQSSAWSPPTSQEPNVLS